MKMMINELFNLISEDGFLTIEFHKNEIEFEKDISFFDDLFFREIKDKNIRIKGKGSVEIYAYAAYWCAKKDCESITITNFFLSRDFEIYRRGKSCSRSLPVWCSVTEETNSVIVSAIPSNSPDGHWDDDTINKTSSCFMLNNPAKLVILTGKGSILFYSIMACSAAVSGCDNVVVEKPTEKDFIKIAGSLFSKSSYGKKVGKMIGVLGDPNSGKSVFSKVFGNILRFYSGKKSVWTYDCDAAAPTSDWYIYGLQRARSQEESDAKINARKSIKQKWTEQLEMKVSEYMKTVKSNLDLVVADFPGGRHDEEKNIHNRIPDKARAEMLKNCDFLIIIARSDVPERIKDWKNALAEYNLADRVIGEVISKNPKDDPSAENCYFDEKNIFHVTLYGLNRETPINSIVSAFLSIFQSFCSPLLLKII